jgi:hypothetical protein
MSTARRILRAQKNGKPYLPNAIELLLFGDYRAPTDEHAEVRKALCDKFRALMIEYEATDAEQLWAWLKTQRYGYDAAKDGPSVTMSLVDDVWVLRDDEGTGRLVAKVVEGLRALNV